MNSTPPAASDVPLPNPPCERCMNDPNCRCQTEMLLTVYCRHRQSGAFFDGRRWTVYTPVGSTEFVALVEQLELRAAELMQARAAGQAD
jgi:hypothetical protein